MNPDGNPPFAEGTGHGSVARDFTATTWALAIGFALAGGSAAGWILHSRFRPPEVRIDVPVAMSDWERIAVSARSDPAYSHWRMSQVATNPVLSLWFHQREGVDLPTISNRLAGTLGAPVNAPVVTPWSMVSPGNGWLWGVIGASGMLAGAFGWTVGQSLSDWRNGARFMGGMGVTRDVPRPESKRESKPGVVNLKDGKIGDVFGTDFGMDFLWIPAGKFLMGSPEGEGAGDECPQTEVTISRPFWMGKYPVRQRDWKAVMGGSPSRFEGEDLPVEMVSWDECVVFGKKLTERMKGKIPAGYEFRLPTGAEWEYACRAGTTTQWSFGNEESALERYGWYDKNAGGKTQPVGQKLSNPWGLYDMHGNVLEWVHDWKGNYPGGRVTDPKGPANGSSRVLRGGSWYYSAGDCRSACRLWSDPGGRWYDLGFRLVLAPRSVL